MSKPTALIPAGNTGVLAGVAETFSLHSSPEEFLASRTLKHRNEHPTTSGKSAVIRAKLLNRNVAIVSSYAQATQVLGGKDSLSDGKEPTYSARLAYGNIIEPFFPSPNLLLTDGCAHAKMRDGWDPVAKNLAAAQSEYAAVARQWFSELPLATDVQLYQTMKYLSWRLILVPTLGVKPGGNDAREIESLQEDVLRGEFATLPVSINTGVWQSARSKGIAAREKLQSILRRRLDEQRPSWLPEAFVQSRKEEVVNHLIIATSSLAVKGLASLLTAMFLNYYFYTRTTGKTLDQNNLEALLKETMRLSPPIIGVMRQTTKDAIIAGADSDNDVLIPKGWDVWTFLAHANRDPEVFGQNSNLFNPDRYSTASDVPPDPLSLGTGPKLCLGREVIKSCCIATLEACKALDVNMVGEEPKPGVKAWLGWETAGPEVWARDMKQMPTQHPTAPVMVQFTRGHNDSRKSYEK